MRSKMLATRLSLFAVLKNLMADAPVNAPSRRLRFGSKRKGAPKRIAPWQRAGSGEATSAPFTPVAHRSWISWPVSRGSVVCALAGAALVWSAGGPARAADQTAELQKRVQQLEQQIGDLQVVIGTLETLAQSNGGGASVAGASGYGRQGGLSQAGGDGEARLSVMETQIRALSAQIEQLSSQMRQMSGGGRRGSNSNGGGSGRVGAEASSYAGRGAVYESGRTEQAPAFAGGFGQTTVTPAAPSALDLAGDDPIGGYLSGSASESGRSSQGWNAGAQRVARAPLGRDDPKSAYETAYGYFLQQDYTSAENAFRDFVGKYPKNTLASNAQYWLGESFFVRGQYKSAASAFLKGYEQFGQGTKGADSLLRLAMSLAKLGQKGSACSSLSELTSRYPDAAPSVKKQARTEARRLRC